MPLLNRLYSIKTHYIPINRTARFHTLGPFGPEAEEIWVVLHGYGQLAGDFIGEFEAINDGSRLIVAPEALSRFYVKRSPDRVGASWMTREDRDHEIDDYLAYLNQVASHFLDVVGRRRIPMTVLGFSQGATTASRWVTLGRMPAGRVILWAGPIAHDIDLEEYRELFERMNLTFVVGNQDYYITPDKLEAEKSRIEAHEIPYSLITFEGEHRIDAHVLKGLVSPAT